MIWITQEKNWSIVVFIVVACFSFGITNLSATIIVETQYGKIIGKTTQFLDENDGFQTVYSFLGVPFASPPVNELRFEPPQRPAAWKPRTYNATFFRNVCPQKNLSYFEKSIRNVWPEFSWENDSNEDCLYLNIFTPGNKPESHFHPVIMFIHGGSYAFGTTARHTTPGEVLPRLGVVLVTIQYRLGPFGFMTAGDGVARGNWGMLDQVEALKWIKENIEVFGGDPNRVTILGVSSGGASVGLHILSPLSEGLFHRAITESGVEFSPFAFNSVKKAIDKTNITAGKLSCDTTSSKRMMDCLRSKSAQSIIDKFDWRNTGPIIDRYFIYDTPKNLRRSGKFNKVPLISGFNSHEGAHNTPQEFHPPRDITTSVLREFINNFVENHILQDNNKTAVIIKDAIEFQYTPWSKTPDSPSLRQEIVNIMSDYYVAAPTLGVLGIHSALAPTYMFEFNHRSAESDTDAWMGVAHGENTPYVFGAPFLNSTALNFTNEDRNISRLIMTLYANFAKYGNPTPHRVHGVIWDRFNTASKLYLRINNRSQMGAYYESRRMAFWNNYYPKILNLTKPESLTKHSRDDVKPTDNPRNYTGEDARPTDNPRNYTGEDVRPTDNPRNYTGEDARPTDNPRNYTGEDVRPRDNPRNYTTCSNIGVKLFLNTGFLCFLSSVLLVLPDVFI